MSRSFEICGRLWKAAWLHNEDNMRQRNIKIKLLLIIYFRKLKLEPWYLLNDVSPTLLFKNITQLLSIGPQNTLLIYVRLSLLLRFRWSFWYGNVSLIVHFTGCVPNFWRANWRWKISGWKWAGKIIPFMEKQIH